MLELGLKEEKRRKARGRREKKKREERKGEGTKRGQTLAPKWIAAGGPALGQSWAMLCWG